MWQDFENNPAKFGVWFTPVLWDAVDTYDYLAEIPNQSDAMKCASTAILIASYSPGMKSSYFKAFKKQLGEFVEKGLGSTWRRIAKNLVEQLTLKEIKADPSLWKVIIEQVNDQRWVWWSKMQYVKNLNDWSKIVVHYVAKINNWIISEIDDFKFID